VVIVLALLIAALAAFAWDNHFIQDDAFISFRYALNLARGQGLLWNPGERVEGYTNFLWTLLMSGAIAWGLDPVRASFALGLTCFVLGLVATFRLARLVLGAPWPALAVVALLGTNYTFSAYATGGLETSLQACLVTWATWLAFTIAGRDGARPLRMALLSLLAGLALLTRLDSALLLVVPYLIAAATVLRPEPATGHAPRDGQRDAGAGATRMSSHGLTGSAAAATTRPLSRRAAGLLALVLPAFLLVAPWLAWKWWYYGDLLPNPFYVKVASGPSLVRGLYYLGLFFVSYLLVHVPVLLAAAFARRPADWREPAGGLFATVMLWSLYIVVVGGDFMEFRLFVPMLPLAFTLLGWLLFRRLRPAWVRAVLAGAVVAGSIHHTLSFGSVRHGVESVWLLENHLRPDRERWARIGQRLGSLFPPQSADVAIATSAAGAIPYYSGLRTVDMLGLNDRWVARHGRVMGSRPGHRRIATVDYLLERRVNLIIGHPWVVGTSATPDLRSPGALLSKFMLHDRPTAQLPSNLRLVELPLDERTKLMMLYLVPSPSVEAALRRGTLLEQPDAAPAGGGPSTAR
jgi:hypothetical protein